MGFVDPPETDPLALPADFNHYKAYVSAGFFFFVVVNGFTKKYLIPESASNSFHQKWKWSNIFTSLIHSTITGLTAPLLFYFDPRLCEDLIDAYNDAAHVLLGFSIGYFLYDFMDMFLYNPKRSTYELLIHHSCVIVCFGISVHSKRYLPYGLLALIVEINSIFLHTRQLFIIQGMSKQEFVYRCVANMNVLTFVLFRILLLGWMTRWITVNRDMISLPFFVSGSIGLAVIISMNAILFYRLLRSDYFHHRSSTHFHHHHHHHLSNISNPSASSTKPKETMFAENNFHPVSKDVNQILHSLFDDNGSDETGSESDGEMAEEKKTYEQQPLAEKKVN